MVVATVRGSLAATSIGDPYDTRFSVAKMRDSIVLIAPEGRSPPAKAMEFLVGTGADLVQITVLLVFLNGGERGIRTLGRVSPTHAFQACSFNHSDISPCL